MATNTIELTGTLEWAKLFEFNRDQGEYDEETDGATAVTLLMDDDVYKMMKDSGVQKSGKQDPDGKGTRVTFKRPWKDKFGRDWADGLPTVFNPAGRVWNTEADGLIGNGSVGVVFLDVYDTKKGVGCRLNGVQVIEHILFESTGGGGGSSFGIKPKDYTSGAAESVATPAPVKSKDYTAPAAAKVAPGDVPF